MFKNFMKMTLKDTAYAVSVIYAAHALNKITDKAEDDLFNIVKNQIKEKNELLDKDKPAKGPRF